MRRVLLQYTAPLDQGMGPTIFVAVHIAQRVAACSPVRVLETGPGIVTRRLRDRLPAGVGLTATDLKPPMLEIAREKFRPGEDVEFKPADGAFGDTPLLDFGSIGLDLGTIEYVGLRSLRSPEVLPMCRGSCRCGWQSIDARFETDGTDRFAFDS